MLLKLINLNYGIKRVKLEIEKKEKVVDIVVSQPSMNVRPKLYYLGRGMKFKELGFGEDKIRLIADVNDQFLDNVMYLHIQQNFAKFTDNKEYDPLDVLD